MNNNFSKGFSMQLVDNTGKLTSMGLWLAGVLGRARGKVAARVARQIVLEYGQGEAGRFIGVITNNIRGL